MKVQVSTPDGSSKANLLWCGWCWRGAILESSLYVYIPLSLTTLKTDPVELTAKILVRARAQLLALMALGNAPRARLKPEP